MFVHDGWVAALRWAQEENLGTEGRAIVRRREVALVACDPAP